MKEMLDFLNDLAFDSYMHLSSNLKLEMFENFLQTLKTVSDYKVSSLKVIKKNYIDYLFSKEKCIWKPLLQLWRSIYVHMGLDIPLEKIDMHYEIVSFIELLWKEKNDAKFSFVEPIWLTLWNRSSNT